MSSIDDGSDEDGVTRRAVLRRGAAAAAVLAFPDAWGRTFGASERTAAPDRPYLDAATRAAHWIARSAVRDGQATTWPADPSDPKSLQSSLYSGSPGVVLFYLELHTAAGGRPADEYLKEARGGADYLLARIPVSPAGLTEGGAGLYTGFAGIAYTLEMVHRATGDARYREGAQRAQRLLRSAAAEQGSGVSWNESTDIISGSAGIGLTMLWAERALGDAAARELAAKAGRRLIELGVPERGGLKWGISDKVPRRYPNFSHGTGGVSYFLATLYGVTRERAFLDAAIAGATYLEAISTRTPNDGLKIFHSEPGNEQLFYLSWCHGPAGTARLYQQLGAVTGDAKWSAYVPKLAQGIIDSGVPEQHPDRSGYWNNISQCCGNCGVSEFFLALHQRTNDAKHLAFARRVMDDTLSRATSDGDGLKWVQAEHRVRPEFLVAQTGLMQGAAGVGLALLHLDGALEKRRPVIVLPDSPEWGESR